MNHTSLLRRFDLATKLVLILFLAWIGERKDFEVYACDISPDGSRLVTAAGGEKFPDESMGQAVWSADLGWMLI